ncbi:MAG: DUF2723 domain-containing protein [Chloroflexi bacterium]|nr:DUF2723 domain-containing protein [Chloroflexota bacterium]
MIISLGAFGIYAITGATTVTEANGGGDSGELVRAAVVLGVPHPTGYPLWILLAHLASLVPIGEPAQRVALFSALCSALAILAVIGLSWELQLLWSPASRTAWRQVAPLLAGTTLAITPLFWSQATIPETYALDSLLQTTGFWLLLRWWRNACPLPVVTLAAALALANHLLALCLLSAIISAVILRTPRPPIKTLLFAVTPFMSTLALYLFLILRARQGVLADWGNPTNVQRLWNLVTAQEYRGFFTSRSPQALAIELLRWPGRLRQNLGIIGAILSLWALGLTFLKQPKIVGPFIIALALNLAIVIRDAAPASPTYLHLTYALLSAFAGLAVIAIPASLTSSQLRAIFTVCLAVLIVASNAFTFTMNWTRLDIHNRTALKNRAIALLSASPRSAILLTEGDNPLFALWYVQDVLGYRPDVMIWSMNLVLDPWYTQTMHQRYPTMVPLALSSSPATATLQLLHYNRASHPILTTTLPPFLTQAYTVTPLATGLWLLNSQ